MLDIWPPKKVGSIICISGEQNPSMGFGHWRVKFMNDRKDQSTNADDFSLVSVLFQKSFWLYGSDLEIWSQAYALDIRLSFCRKAKILVKLAYSMPKLPSICCQQGWRSFKTNFSGARVMGSISENLRHWIIRGARIFDDEWFFRPRVCILMPRRSETTMLRQFWSQDWVRSSYPD